jgi:hypothetical protein
MKTDAAADVVTLAISRAGRVPAHEVGMDVAVALLKAGLLAGGRELVPTAAFIANTLRGADPKRIQPPKELGPAVAETLARVGYLRGDGPWD